MADLEARMHVLDMIESGQISASQGLQLLEALSGQPSDEDLLEELEAGTPKTGMPDDDPTPQFKDRAAAYPPGSSFPRPASAPPTGVHPSILSRSPAFPEINDWRRWWIIPFWAGLGLTLLSGMVVFSALALTGAGFWFFFFTLPFVLGVGIMLLGWWSRSASWLYLRVEQAPGEWPQRIVLSFPLPVRPLAWFLRRYRRKFPVLNKTSLDEIILALGANATPQNPFFVEVEDGGHGEKVKIFIG